MTTLSITYWSMWELKVKHAAQTFVFWDIKLTTTKKNDLNEIKMGPFILNIDIHFINYQS